MARKKTTASNQDELLSEFQALVRDTESLLQQSAGLAGDQGEELRDQIRNSLNRARSTLVSAEEAVIERGKAAVDATEGYVQTHPWQSISIAAGVGMLLGMLITKR
ncbi:DUF883 family protein [Pseudomonas sp. EL_65y_Pfl2_R95]|uniref:DUF883 family protein n=1 Tax=Pseudomonas sp. EL_65y_Pfl2_R95 TaxID=3088698 RepID=UPI0030D7C2A9